MLGRECVREDGHFDVALVHDCSEMNVNMEEEIWCL